MWATRRELDCWMKTLSSSGPLRNENNQDKPSRKKIVE
jgi:hypothetical protein